MPLLFENTIKLQWNLLSENTIKLQWNLLSENTIKLQWISKLLISVIITYSAGVNKTHIPWSSSWGFAMGGSLCTLSTTDRLMPMFIFSWHFFVKRPLCIKILLIMSVNLAAFNIKIRMRKLFDTVIPMFKVGNILTFSVWPQFLKVLQ